MALCGYWVARSIPGSSPGRAMTTEKLCVNLTETRTNPPYAFHSSKPRPKPLLRRLDVSGERRADMARQHQGACRRAHFEHHAAALPRLFGVGVFREIPVRVVDLQQM